VKYRGFTLTEGTIIYHNVYGLGKVFSTRPLLNIILVTFGDEQYPLPVDFKAIDLDNTEVEVILPYYLITSAQATKEYNVTESALRSSTALHTTQHLKQWWYIRSELDERYPKKAKR
jgi:hypothetical protein